jgi:hypothetical protein
MVALNGIQGQHYTCPHIGRIPFRNDQRYTVSGHLCLKRPVLLADNDIPRGDGRVIHSGQQTIDDRDSTKWKEELRLTHSPAETCGGNHREHAARLRHFNGP